MMFKALRVRMLEKEILQGDVARLAGMAESTMTSRMQGRQPFTTWEIAAIARVLDIRPEDWHRYFYECSPEQKRAAQGAATPGAARR